MYILTNSLVSTLSRWKYDATNIFVKVWNPDYYPDYEEYEFEYYDYKWVYYPNEFIRYIPSQNNVPGSAVISVRECREKTADSGTLFWINRKAGLLIKYDTLSLMHNNFKYINNAVFFTYFAKIVRFT